MILLLTTDLMFQSRISGSARAANKECLVDRSVEKFVERVLQPADVSLILIDLTLRSVDLDAAIPFLQSNFPSGKIIAYGPHVDTDRLSQAESAGANMVLTRGQMDRDLNAIIEGA